MYMNNFPLFPAHHILGFLSRLCVESLNFLVSFYSSYIPFSIHITILSKVCVFLSTFHHFCMCIWFGTLFRYFIFWMQEKRKRIIRIERRDKHFFDASAIVDGHTPTTWITRSYRTIDREKRRRKLEKKEERIV